MSYNKLSKIGEGTYATVYKGLDISSNTIVALKEIKLNSEEGTPATAIREIAFLKELKHPNIINLLDLQHTSSNLVLVFEMMDQDLKVFLENKKLSERNLTVYEIKRILFQILSGVCFCHRNHIIHRDLKPQNILINRDGCVKISDFGLSRTLGVPINEFSSEVVTLWYRAPELLSGSTQYSESIDIWSIGCIMAELFLGKPLFNGKNNKEVLSHIMSLLYTSVSGINNHTHSSEGRDFLLERFHKILDDYGMDLLRKLLCYESKNRISADEALKHCFFSDLAAA